MIHQKSRFTPNNGSQNDVFSTVKRVYLTALILLTPLFVTYTGSAINPTTLTTYGSLYFIAIMAWTVYTIIRSNAEMIWTAFALFPLQSAVFFGIGPLVYEFGNSETYYQLSSSLVFITPGDLLRANLLSQLGATLVMFGMLISLKFIDINKYSKQLNNTPDFPISFVMVMFLTVGFILKYLLIIPARWGMINVNIPGSLNALTALVDLGFAILAYLAVHTNWLKWKALFWVFWPIHLILCLISLSKATVLLAVLLPLLGAYIANRNAIKFAIGMAFAALTYINLQPWIEYGRDLNLEKTGTTAPSNYSQGLSRLSDYMLEFSSNNTQLVGVSSSQGWWTRLNYSGEQVFVMNLYESGAKSERLNDFWMSFIPRAIWPEKPIMSREGNRLYSLITGHEGMSSSGVTIYGDMYWHYGWLGIWAISPLIGVLFMLLSRFCLSVIQSRNFIYFPIVGLCLQMFMIGPTSFLVVSIIGPIPIILVYLTLIYLFHNVLVHK